MGSPLSTDSKGFQHSYIQTERQTTKDPYRDYLANKTTLLPALAEMKQGFIHERVEKVY